MPLPFSMVAELVAPIKVSNYKITLEAHQGTLPSLASLFEDIMAGQPMLQEAAGCAGGTALSVRYHCGLDATVLVSKSAGRFRVQSSSFEGLWLLANELVNRLSASHMLHEQRATGDEEPCTILYTEPLPLQVCSQITSLAVFACFTELVQPIQPCFTEFF